MTNSTDEKVKYTVNEWHDDLALEVTLNDDDGREEVFLKVKETLTRMGISHNKTLFQSCHIFQKRGKYYISHFKELLALDGKAVNFSSADIDRRDKVAFLLERWGLITVKWKQEFDLDSNRISIHTIPFKAKSEWDLVPKYTINGRKTDDG